MTTGLQRLLTLTFGAGGNEANYLGSGWSSDEPGARWMLGQVSELWLDNQGGDHDLILELDTEVFVVPPAVTAQRLMLGVRNIGIAQIAAHHGGVLGFHIPAKLAAGPGPVRLLFIHPDFRRPMDVQGSTDDRPLSFALRGLTLSRVLPRPAPAGGAPLLPQQMIARFESLGDNCEFGLVQRRLGADPLGLLRFSFIERIALLRGLRSGFEGLGDAGTTEVAIEGKEREYVVKETAYGITYHTFQYADRIELETVQAQQAARLRFLKRKLLEDIAAGEKIFVVKRAEPLRPEEILPIYTTLNEQGRSWLLWVVLADATHPSGTVEVLLPGLLRGYIDRFAPYDDAHDIALPAWTSVCEAAWRAVGGQRLD